MKFQKIHTIAGTLVIVPDQYFRKMREKIKESEIHVAKTRMYYYMINDDGTMWRYPRPYDFTQKPDKRFFEQVVAQMDFVPEVMIV